MTQPTITAADREAMRRWYGKLPRPEFNMFLLALNDARNEGRQAESARWAKAMREAVSAGYLSPARKVDKCEHDKFGWEDCGACYDEALLAAIDATEANGGGV